MMKAFATGNATAPAAYARGRSYTPGATSVPREHTRKLRAPLQNEAAIRQSRGLFFSFKPFRKPLQLIHTKSCSVVFPIVNNLRAGSHKIVNGKFRHDLCQSGGGGSIYEITLSQ